MPPISAQRVRIGTGGLTGVLDLPASAAALVLCAHAGGDSRLGASKGEVAQVLHGRGVGTLLCDLFGAVEAAGPDDSEHIAPLADSFGQILDWIARQRVLARLQLGLFASGRGAAAALETAVSRPGRVAAVVSFGGRLDLAAHCLMQVDAPTLLIVGDADGAVTEINRGAMHLLTGSKRLEILPGSAHLVGEPATLASVAELAAAWFASHLIQRRYI